MIICAVALRLRALFRRRKVEMELEDELRFHMEAATERYVARGVAPEEARLRSLREFGGLEQAKEECRDARGTAFFDALAQDLRYGWRMLGRSPGFSAAAVLTLALGIGAGTAIFSIINGVLLKPLRFDRADELVRLFEENIRGDLDGSDVSAANFVDWRAQSRAFDGIAAIVGGRFNLTGGAEPETVVAMMVTADFFRLLRAHPVLGRTFTPGEFPLPGGAPAVGMISYGLWQRRFGGRRDVTGRAVRLDDHEVAVIGVLPADFGMTEMRGWGTADVWLPRSYAENENRRARYLSVIARRRAGVSEAQARAEMDILARQLSAAWPGDNAGWRVQVVPLLDTIVGNVRRELLVLAGAVGFVLLIACANVANLLLARGAARKREIAVRCALGAGRGRVARQLLTESALLALLGGTLGFALAAWGVRALVAFRPHNLPRLDEIAADWTVLGFSFAAAVLTGILCGLFPALRLAHGRVSEALQDAGPTTAGGRNPWLTRALAVIQVALALVLLVGAGLMVRGFLRLHALNLGFRPKNVLTILLTTPLTQHATLDQIVRFRDEIVRRIERLPAVDSAASGTAPPLFEATWAFEAEGQPREFRCGLDAPQPHYFRALGIPILKGRGFDDRDRADAPDVAIVTRALAREVWPGENPIGKRMTLERQRLTVVGMTDDIRDQALDKAPIRQVFVPLAQTRIFLPGTLIVRTRIDPMRVLGDVRQAIWSVDRNVAVSRVATMEQRLAGAMAQRRFALMLLGIFSALAFALATVGVYGVMAYAVTIRTREIGIRMAIGATQSRVLRMVLGQGVLVLAAGEALGVAAAFGLNRVMSGVVMSGVSTTDPATYTTVMLVWAAAVIAACYVPARRAARVDPMSALRWE